MTLIKTEGRERQELKGRETKERKREKKRIGKYANENPGENETAASLFI